VPADASPGTGSHSVARAIVTTVVREAGMYEPSGFVRVVDLERRSVVRCWPMVESRRRALDTNPRGGLRGAKGVGVHGDRLVVANVERLFVFDPGERHSAPVPGSPAFARGLASLGDGRFLVGSQAPAALHTVDLAGGRVVESLDLGGRERETVYAVALLPSQFDDPPARLDWTGPFAAA
jgi:hypothetical protein